MKYTVKIGDGYIRIYKGKKEIVGWVISEWEENPQVVYSICNAIQLAYKGTLEKVLIKNK